MTEHDQVVASVRLAMREEMEPLKSAVGNVTTEVMRHGKLIDKFDDVLNGPDGVVARLGIVAEIQANCQPRRQWDVEQTTRTQTISRAKARKALGLPVDSDAPPPAASAAETAKAKATISVGRWQAIAVVAAALIGFAGMYAAGRTGKPSTPPAMAAPALTVSVTPQSPPLPPNPR